MNQKMFSVVIVENGHRRVEGIAVNWPYSWKATEVAREAYPDAEFVGALVTHDDVEEAFYAAYSVAGNHKVTFPYDIVDGGRYEPFRGCYDTVEVTNRHSGAFICSYKVLLDEHRTKILGFEKSYS